MFRGLVTIRHDITGLRQLKLEPLTFTPEGFRDNLRITVETPNERTLDVKVHFEGINDAGGAKAIAYMLAEVFVDRIGFKFNVQIAKPHDPIAELDEIPSASVPPDSLVGEVSSSWTLTTIGHAVYEADAKDMHELNNLLMEGSSHRDAWLSKYRWSLNHSDPVAIFLHLYSILLAFNSDRQDKVDKFIKDNEDGVGTEWTTIKDKNGKPKSIEETPYTRLRNEIGHVRAGSDPRDTRAAMELRLEGLALLARKAIEIHC